MSQLPASTYSDIEVAELYDVLNPWRPTDDFYLNLVMTADTVLDVGCGTGSILKRAREAGHSGRLVGVDPDPAMLAVARRQPELDIVWHQSAAATMPWDATFDRAIMSGHAFQCLISDADVRDSLAAIHRALAPGGTFIFDTRNPALREWEQWDRGTPMSVTDPAGRELQISYEVLDVTGEVVTLTETTSDREGQPLRVDRGQLRFLGIDPLTTFLTNAGFEVDAQYGSWDRAPLTSTSPEVITVARRPAGCREIGR